MLLVYLICEINKIELNWIEMCVCVCVCVWGGEGGGRRSIVREAII